MMLSVKHEGIQYHLSEYDSTWDWTSVSLTIGEYSNQMGWSVL